MAWGFNGGSSESRRCQATGGKTEVGWLGAVIAAAELKAATTVEHESGDDTTRLRRSSTSSSDGQHTS